MKVKILLPTPESLVCQKIDQLLAASRWIIQDAHKSAFSLVELGLYPEWYHHFS